MMTPRRLNTVIGIVLMVTLSPFTSSVGSAEETQAPEPLGVQVAYGAAATLLTVANVPLKAALCGATSVMSGLAYLVTFGSKPVARDASDAITAVCTGPYIITPQRLRTDPE